MQVAVVGLGVVGHLVALRLLAKGIQPHIFTDPNTPSCAPVAAAMLAPVAELDTAEKSIFTLGMASLPLWQEVAIDLAIKGALVQSGSIMIAHREDAAELLHLHTTIQCKLGAETTTHMQQIGADALHALEPNLERFHNGLFFPHEGYLNNQVFLHASEKRLAQRAKLTHAHVKGLTSHTVITDTNHRFDWVIDCRGLGAKSDMNNLRGMRGEIIRIHAPDITLHRPVRLAHPRYKLYIVPRPEHHYIIGATEIEAHDDSPVSVRSCLELLSAAYSVNSGFAEARIVNMHSASRPTCTDNNPCVETQDGLIRINGLYRHGYLIAPALVQQALAPLD